VERRPAARRDAGGGEVVQASRQARPALIAGLAAVALAAATGAAVALRTDDSVAAAAAGGLGAVAVLTLAAGLVLRRPALVAPSAAILGTGYAIGSVSDGGPLDLNAPLVGVALLLTCELGFWAVELRTTSPDEPGAHAKRVAWLALLGLGTFLPAVALLALADLLQVQGIAVEVAGAVAAAALIATVLFLARLAARAA
jgi:hypothetical protein